MSNQRFVTQIKRLQDQLSQRDHELRLLQAKLDQLEGRKPPDPKPVAKPPEKPPVAIEDAEAK